jgi:hypothetical protein
MRSNRSKYLVPALLAAAIPATVVLAQQAPQQPPQQPDVPHKRAWPDRPRFSPEARKRLEEGRLEGRITEIKEALKLNESQLKLWAPVEQQLRARFAQRQRTREEFMQRLDEQRQPSDAAERPSLPERLDRMTKRMSERAQQMQAFTEAFKPFYATLSEEQKAIAGVVLHDLRGRMHGPGRRWAMERGPAGPDGRPPREGGSGGAGAPPR